MAKIDQSLLGCVLSQRFAEETDQRMADSGLQVEFRVAQSQFNGRWEGLKKKGVRAVLLWPLGQKFRPLLPHHQRRGTCVARGAHKAIESSYLHSLGNQLAVGEAVEIAWEPIYAGSRVYPGQGRLGSGDGSVGPWAAEWMAGIKGIGGICRRGVYGSADLSKDNESWSVQNGNRGSRLPKELLDELQNHTCSVHRVRNNTEIADSISSYFGIFRCWDTLFGNRDRNGQCVASDTGAHCQAVIGVYVDQDGEDSFVEIQSWGMNMPSGPSEIVLQGGERVQLPPACYGVKASNFVKAQRRSQWWDAHAVCVRPGQEFRGAGGGTRSVSEMERLAS
jgi:hypothetical protein